MDSEDFVNCPIVPSHRMLKTTLQNHTIRCRKQQQQQQQLQQQKLPQPQQQNQNQQYQPQQQLQAPEKESEENWDNILQNLGKVDRTADDIFDEHLQNFTRQQNAANRLQKEFNNYIRCIRAAQAASKTLLEAIGETYESQWTGHDLLYVQTQSVDMLWQDFSHKLADQVLLPLNTYQSQFAEMRKKIDKRGRKLVDYDSQRHSFQALQTNMKKRDEAKIAKGQEQLEEAKRTYNLLNSELHDELPALYDSRVLFLVTNLQSLFNAEHVFHSEAAKVFGELEAIVDKLATDSQRGSYSVKKTNGATPTNSSSLPRNTTPNKSSPTPLIINNISSVNNSAHPAADDPPSATQSPTTTITKNASADSESAGSVSVANQQEQKSPTTTTEPTYANDISPPVTPSKKNSASSGVAPSSPGALSSPTAAVATTPTSPKSLVEQLNGVTTPDGKHNKPPTSPVEPQPPHSPPVASSNVKNALWPVLPPPQTPHHENEHNAKEAPSNNSNNNEKNEQPPPASINNNPISNNNAAPQQTNNSNSKNNVEELYDIPVGASTENLPPGVLYRVKATYKYNREDVDELSFEVGETIQVIEYDDPEEQEEGWLMGVKENTGEKGMFPANFTRPL